MRAEHERRLVELERAHRRPVGVEVSEETVRDIVAGSALFVGEGTPRPERAYSAFGTGGMEALAEVDARVAAEVAVMVEAYASGGLDALAALDARVADDVLLRVGTLADRGL